MPKFLKLQEGWITVGLLGLLLFSVTLSVQHAQWSDGLSILTPITLIGLVTGIVLAKVRGVPRSLLDMLGLLAGLVTVLVMVASVMNDPTLTTIQQKVQDLIARTATWVGVAVRQDMSDDLVVFVLSLAVVCWVLAYSSAYFVFRTRQLWWALVPNGVALLINLSYAPSYVNIQWYIVIFMLSALLLMIRFNLLVKEERWQRERVNYSPALTWRFLWAGSSASILIAAAMWFVPATAVNGTLNGMWEKVNQPWVDFQNNMGKLWSQLPGNQSIGGYSAFNKSFTMGGSLNLSDSIALMVKASQPQYWRATTWDTYTSSGWTNTSADTFHVEGLSPRLALEANQKLISDDSARTEITYTVQVVSPKGDVIFAPLRPVSLTVPSRLELSWRKLDKTWDLDNLYAVDGVGFNSVPLELRSLLSSLRSAQGELRTNGGAGTDQDIFAQLEYTDKRREISKEIKQKIEELGKRGIFVIVDWAGGAPYNIEVRASGEVPVYDDISGVHALGPIGRNEQYTVVSLVSQADEEQLRVAGGNYEDWVEDRYLNLPATVPQRVRDLAEQIVTEAGAVTPYDQAKAIEAHLRDQARYKYNTSIPLPPSGMDRVEWFLFQGKEGYCEYYASAMIVMLRHLGIPSRLAGGYAPGTYDEATQSWIVRESAAHAWPEVYFPGYGWIEFEPTPSQAVITRDPEADSEEKPTPEPTAEPTPEEDLPEERDEREPRPIPATEASTDESSGPPWGGIAAGILALLLALAGLAYWKSLLPWQRKGDTLSAAAYYRRMVFWARLLRVGPSPHHTPYEFSETLAREVRGASLFTRTIARAYVRERYGRDALPITERISVRRAWDSLRSRLWRMLPSRQFRRLMQRRRI